MINKNKVALAILLTFGINTSLQANYASFERYPHAEHSAMYELQENENILGDPRQFLNENGSFILQTEEWLQIQLFTEAAKGLPTTEESMKTYFQITDHVAFDGVYNELLKSYEEINDIASLWSGPSGHMSKMVNLAGDLMVYSKSVVWSATKLEDATEDLLAAARAGDEVKFQESKMMTLALLSIMQNQTESFYKDTTKMDDELTIFSETLSLQAKRLAEVERLNAGILLNDGTAEQYHIEELVREKDELNAEYTKWVTVGATTPTYAWVYPLGTIAAIGAAAASTAYAVDLKIRLDAKKEDLERARDKLTTTQAVYTSWVLATTNIDRIQEPMLAARNSLNKLRGGWSQLNSQIKGVLMLIESIDSESVIHNPNSLTAAFSTSSIVENIICGWNDVGNTASAWQLNAYITESLEYRFKLGN
ncbi:alpha-xenorhabdolysin family binary toxin subunit A [Moritella sp. 36]|uniref:alpha-xenorhabdolysin family binary toxin subunit A n=1 Tax=Moritella sp. 36 TaxID=2746233 RepID=UPI001BA74E8A|nr:alpha-xenorhabdolysin family binary toxin subunit A [Moritella sp. 36]QUM90491.1 alpha-xenorhabdolysin family binary toxin subunit A [Moritella sp. 36]